MGLGPDSDDRTVGVIQKVHGKQFVQPEIIRWTQRRMAKRSQGTGEKLPDMVTNNKSH